VGKYITTVLNGQSWRVLSYSPIILTSSPGAVTARDPFVLTLTVCYQTQLITEVLPYRHVLFCTMRSGSGGVGYEEAKGHGHALAARLVYPCCCTLRTISMFILSHSFTRS
jgi:hypothetical protein